MTPRLVALQKRILAFESFGGRFAVDEALKRLSLGAQALLLEAMPRIRAGTASQVDVANVEAVLARMRA